MSSNREPGCLGCLLDINMRRSWPQYIYVTLQGAGLILPRLALIRKHMPPFGQSFVQYKVTFCIELS